MRIALLGNPNSGKSTLFNALTGLHQHVGNFPGVTVEQHTGTLRDLPGGTLIDLPGTYSLTAASAEERVCSDMLRMRRPDAIINIVDATCLSRGLYVTLQLLTFDIPMVVALNMMDEVQKSGGRIDVEKLSKHLGVPVVPISAARREGLSALLQAVAGETGRAGSYVTDNHVADRHVAGGSMADGKHSRSNNGPKRHESAYDHGKVNGTGIVNDLMIQERYARIDAMMAEVVSGLDGNVAHSLSRKLDAVLMHPVFAFPIFTLIMGFVFACTFGPIGQALTRAFGLMQSAAASQLSAVLSALHVSEWMHELLVEGIMTGIGVVLAFLPTLLILFFMLSLLEDSGYMARMTYVSDRFFRKIGLSGRSFVPALLGFGCSVPAMMATRTLSTRRDRYATVLLVPFLSCSAKLPIYALLTQVFFKDHALLVVMGLYAGGVLLGLLAAWVLSRTILPDVKSPFLMELPNYRLPTLRSALMLVRTRIIAYVRTALTTLLFASVAIWSLQRVDLSLQPCADNAQSILAVMGRMLSPLFVPLGFGDWRATTSLITGLMAKEGVLSTMGILLGAPTESALQTVLPDVFTPLSALSFLVFVLLYMPCMAAFATARRELGGLRYALLNALFHTGIAWLAALVVYNIGRICGM